MTHKFHRFWMKVTAIIVGSFAPVLFLGAVVPTSAPARLTLDLLGWRLNQASRLATTVRLTASDARG
jgi:hypothetical protein